MQKTFRLLVLVIICAGTLSACAGNDSSVDNQTPSLEVKQLQRSMKATAVDYQNAVQELYVSYFGRPADPTGLANFEAALLAANAPTDIQGLNSAYATNLAVKTLVNSFEISAESVALYGNSSTTAFVTAIYQNVLGRAPDTAGLNFWVTAISNGTLTRSNAALSIMAGALSNNSTQGLSDAQLVKNRLAAASYFTSQVSEQNEVGAYAGASAAASARSMLSAVSATSSVSAYDASVNTTVSALIAALPAPLSGIYAYALTSQGAGNAPTLGISLVHPSIPTIQFVIEPATSAVADVRLVSSGSVAVSSMTISNIQPFALLYIVGGDVRRLPLVANGIAPLSQVTKAGSTNACKFLVDGNDYATPTNSRYIVSTAGADGICGTADDDQAEVTLDTAGGVHVGPRGNYSPAPVIGMQRESATLAPAYWIVGSGLNSWKPSEVIIFRLPGEPMFTGPVVQTSNSFVTTYGNQLSVVDFDGAAGPVAETKLDATVTAGTGWQSIGFDSNNYYVYINASGSWTILKITRSSPQATLLATGIGQIEFAAMGTNLLYATVASSSGNLLYSFDKSTGSGNIMSNNGSSGISMVLTSGYGVHQMWTISGLNAVPSYNIDMIDESGHILYTGNGGFVMNLADAATIDLDNSESRSQFVFATGYGALEYGNANLISYDAATQVVTTLGTIPSSAAFGANQVYASIIGSSSGFMAGFADGISSGSLLNTGASLYSVNVGVPGSMTFTTSSK